MPARPDRKGIRAFFQTAQSSHFADCPGIPYSQENAVGIGSSVVPDHFCRQHVVSVRNAVRIQIDTQIGKHIHFTVRSGTIENLRPLRIRPHRDTVFLAPGEDTVNPFEITFPVVRHDVLPEVAVTDQHAVPGDPVRDSFQVPVHVPCLVVEVAPLHTEALVPIRIILVVALQRPVGVRRGRHVSVQVSETGLDVSTPEVGTPSRSGLYPCHGPIETKVFEQIQRRLCQEPAGVQRHPDVGFAQLVEDHVPVFTLIDVVFVPETAQRQHDFARTFDLSEPKHTVYMWNADGDESRLVRVVQDARRPASHQIARNIRAIFRQQRWVDRFRRQVDARCIHVVDARHCAPGIGIGALRERELVHAVKGRVVHDFVPLVLQRPDQPHIFFVSCHSPRT